MAILNYMTIYDNIAIYVILIQFTIGKQINHAFNYISIYECIELCENSFDSRILVNMEIMYRFPISTLY